VFSFKELCLPPSHVKETLRCVIHSLVFCRSLSDRIVCSPQQVFSELLSLTYIKCEDKEVDRVIDEQVQATADLLDQTRAPQTLYVSFYNLSSSTTTPAFSLHGLFSLHDEKVIFEAWEFPLRLIVSNRDQVVASPRRNPQSMFGIVPSFKLSRSPAQSASASHFLKTSVVQTHSRAFESEMSSNDSMNDEKVFKSASGLQTSSLDEAKAVAVEVSKNVREALDFILDKVNSKLDHLPPPPSDYPTYRFDISTCYPSRKWLHKFQKNWSIPTFL